MNRLPVILLMLMTFTACSQVEAPVQSPPGYDFNHPVLYKMPDALQEISGIAFIPGKNDMLYAIEDEDGILYRWPAGNPAKLMGSRFGKEGDYEDIAISNIYSFVLRSDGTLFGFPNKDIGQKEIPSVRKWKDLLPAGEYESLYADPEANELYVLCKQCDADQGTAGVSGYVLRVDTAGEPALRSSFKIDTRQITGLKGKKRTALKASALTFNKKTGEWFVLSSVNKMLIIADKAWNVRQVVLLHLKEFPQPEGISFDTDQNLYISNEAGSTDAGTVLKFPLKNAGH